uniref:Uncharacterized protein n=1 Tax=Cucumis melo TaxID=3656 RepID=A0A9I9E2R8_CUCME
MLKRAIYLGKPGENNVKLSLNCLTLGIWHTARQP